MSFVKRHLVLRHGRSQPMKRKDTDRKERGNGKSSKDTKSKGSDKNKRADRKNKENNRDKRGDTKKKL